VGKAEAILEGLFDAVGPWGGSVGGIRLVTEVGVAAGPRPTFERDALESHLSPADRKAWEIEQSWQRRDDIAWWFHCAVNVATPSGWGRYVFPEDDYDGFGG
jgi:hypothetical protein